MIEPSDFGLPFPEWRPVQWAIIERAVSTEKKIILIEAPPGIGKTGIAVAIGKLLGSTVHYLTGTKQLQEQYLSIPGLVEVKGRPNFQCAIDERVTASDGICTLGMSCEFAGTEGLDGCGYFDQKRLAQRSPHVVFNYSYWLYQMNYASSFKSPDVLICDEAHTVKNHVRGFVTVFLSSQGLQDAGIPEPKQVWMFPDHQQWALENLPDAQEYLARVKQENRGHMDRAWLRQIARLQGLIRNMKFLTTRRDEWIVTRLKSGWEYKPVWVDQLVPGTITRHVQEDGKIVFMSATILDSRAFCRLHGLEEADVEFIKAASPFQIDRRPIRYYPIKAIGKGTDHRDFQNAIRDVLDAHPRGRGLIHTTSYRLRDIVMDLGDERFITHGASDRLAALRDYKARPDSILVTPSMTTGVDLPYDLCEWQIMCKIPFPDLGDPQIKAAMREEPCPACGGDISASANCPVCKGKGKVTNKLGQLAYNYDTATTLIQTYGRIMRADDDRGVTYLLDANWKWFRVANRELFPRWFTDAIKGWNPYE